MIKLQVKHSDWVTTQTYWKDLQKLLVTPDDHKKAEFVNRVIFESGGVNEIISNSVKDVDITETEIPSINTISQIMKEIDSESRIASDDSKKETPESVTTTVAEAKTETETLVAKMDEKIKQFMSEPVKYFTLLIAHMLCQ